MSGFRGFRAQVELLCGFLEKGAALEHVTIEPQVKLECTRVMNEFIIEWKINEWHVVSWNGLVKRSPSHHRFEGRCCCRK
ncbi:hypothetical protein BAE44_0020481 [Dichanthelium oligosanthes]|uniref:FBD domain-containing protein n=1 Tax=Dichanthelium oligosanthes TaxID=888268 RepID=A0A1E5V042_9POAL|nr:hypothetical protein BAE44_0020481 [Dichanthelium oligosanthes]